MAGAFCKSFVAEDTLSIEKKCERIITDEGPIASHTEASSGDLAQGDSHFDPVSVEQRPLVDKKVLQPYFGYLVWGTEYRERLL